MSNIYLSSHIYYSTLTLELSGKAHVLNAIIFRFIPQYPLDLLMFQAVLFLKKMAFLSTQA